MMYHIQKTMYHIPKTTYPVPERTEGVLALFNEIEEIPGKAHCKKHGGGGASVGGLRQQQFWRYLLASYYSAALPIALCRRGLQRTPVPAATAQAPNEHDRDGGSGAGGGH